MAELVRLEIWQLRDAYALWCLYTSDMDSDRSLWDYYLVVLGLRDRRRIRRGGR